MDDFYQNAFSSLSTFNDAQNNLNALQTNHKNALNNLCNELAKAIRDIMPDKISIELCGTKLKISYLSKFISLEPDLENKLWRIEASGPRFAAKFKQKCGNSCNMTMAGLKDLAKSITEFFTGNFKTMKKLISETEIHSFRRKQHDTDFPFSATQKLLNKSGKPDAVKTSDKPIAGKIEMLGEQMADNNQYKSEYDANQAKAASEYRKDMTDRNTKKKTDRDAAYDRMNPKKILGEEMAASAQPADGLKVLNKAMQATGLHKALAKANVKNMLSKDRQSIVFYVPMGNGQIRPILSLSLINMMKPNELETALDSLGDISKNQAPGMGKQERQRIKDHENALRQAAKQFIPQSPQQPKPIPQVFANV